MQYINLSGVLQDVSGQETLEEVPPSPLCCLGRHGGGQSGTVCCVLDSAVLSFLALRKLRQAAPLQTLHAVHLVSGLAEVDLVSRTNSIKLIIDLKAQV